MSRNRARNLDDDTIRRVVEILDGWSGKLTWDLLLERVKTNLRVAYTRQTLHRHVRIQEAFREKKRFLSEGSCPKENDSISPELRLAQQRISRLENEVARLTRENDRLLEQFARWAFNASTRALDAAFLNQPLPTVHREPSRERR